MSEFIANITQQESLGADFHVKHVVAPSDYKTYVNDQVAKWNDKIEDGEFTPFWLRRNDELENGVVDYVMLSDKGMSVYATVAIDETDNLQVWLPKDDGTGEPVVVSSALMTETSLGWSVQFVEDTYC